CGPGADRERTGRVAGVGLVAAAVRRGERHSPDAVVLERRRCPRPRRLPLAPLRYVDCGGRPGTSTAAVRLQPVHSTQVRRRTYGTPRGGRTSEVVSGA